MTTPNIVLITVDCFRYDRCGFNGHHRETTPALDRIADESYVFDRAYASGPQTVESFPGIIAGRHSHECCHTADNIGWKAIPSDAPTLATHLTSHGYDTAALLTNAFITEKQNYHRGFDRFLNLEAGDIEETDTESGMLSSWFGNVTTVVENRLKQQESVVNPYMLLYVAYQYRRLRTGWPCIHAEDVIDGFIDQIDTLESPFFGWTHLMDLHLPIHPRIANEQSTKKNSLFSHFLAEGANAGDIYEPGFDRIYDGALAYVDSQIQRVLDYLTENGLLDETVVIVTGDHGEALCDRGIYGHPAHYLYDELLHVPLLVRRPSREAKRVDEAFSLAWLHELIADLVNIERGSFPASSGRASHISGDDRGIAVADSVGEFGHTIAVRDGNHKYVTHYRADKLGPEETPLKTDPRNDPLEDTCFRTRSDMGERHPLPGDEAPDDLRQEAQRRGTEPTDLSTVEYETTKRVRDRLEELGYKM